MISVLLALLILDKEKEDRLRQAELVKTKAAVTRLESRLAAAERDKQKQRIEWEKDRENLIQEHQVSTMLRFIVF